MDPSSDRQTRAGPVSGPDARVLVCRLPVPGAPAPDYWEAGAFAAAVLAGFEERRSAGDDAGERRAFFLLARYYGRTLAILRRALSDGATDLIDRALENLVVLHRHLVQMRADAREAVPLVVTLDRASRQRVLPDLVVAVMDDTSRPLGPADVADHVNDLHLAARTRVDAVAAVLERLRSEGALEPVAGGLYRRSTRPYRRAQPRPRGAPGPPRGPALPRLRRGGLSGARRDRGPARGLPDLLLRLRRVRPGARRRVRRGRGRD